jgi:predicted glycosyltransferase
MGHLFRSVELVRALEGHDVVLVAGGREVDVKLPDHVTLVRLPPKRLMIFSASARTFYFLYWKSTSRMFL